MSAEQWYMSQPPTILAATLFECMEQYASQFKKEWISVEDRLPEDTGCYLCFTNDQQIMVCHVAANGWWSKVPDASCYGDMGNNVTIDSKEVEREVTHWQPLPTIPNR